MAKSRNKIFKDFTISNKVSRNGFDLSFTNKFTGKIGELLPLMHRDVMIGDSWRISLNSFTRTRPIVSPSYTSINEYFDFFFVPYRVLGKKIPHVIVQDTSNPTIALSESSNQRVGAKVPYTYLSKLRGFSNSVYDHFGTRVDNFGFYRFKQSNKLLNFLGYCFQSDEQANDELPFEEMFASDLEVSLLPLAAYQKIYYDFYRNTQWEDSIPYNYNFDYMGEYPQYELPSFSNNSYWNNHTMFDMCYANFPKDLFFGLLPDNQLGDTAVVPVDVTATASPVINLVDSDNSTINFVPDSIADQSALQNAIDPHMALVGEAHVNLSAYSQGLKAQFDILEWRKSNFVQKYREIMGTGRKDYKSIVQKIFNVNVPDTLTDMCIYLGGHSQKVTISDVDNTNLVDDNSAIQKGKGVGSGNSDLIEFEAKEPGIIMCIYHAQPEIDYALNAPHFDVVKTEVDDFPNPVFDRLGLQELPVYYLDNSVGMFDSTQYHLGYTNRYFDAKTSIDVVLGDFRNSVDMRSWVAPITAEFLKQFATDDTIEDSPVLVINANFFKVNPHLLDSIFDVSANDFSNTDQLRVNTSFKIGVVRNLDYLGMYF